VSSVSCAIVVEEGEETRWPKPVEYAVVHRNALTLKVDVLAMKYAQQPYGLDLDVAARLFDAGLLTSDLELDAGEHLLVETHDAIGAPWALFLGTPPVDSFDYREIREF